MINPVNNYTTTEYQPQANRPQRVDSGEHFSLDSALEKQDDNPGVIYERSTDKKKSENEASSSSSATKQDTFESTLEEAIATRAEREKEQPDELSVFMYAWFDKLQNFFVKLWKNIKTVFGNLWDSKPIADGLDINMNKASDKTPSEGVEYNTLIPEAESSNSIASELENAEDINDESEIANLEAVRDANIRKALNDGDKDKFRTLISNGGKRVPARSTSAITTYDSHGNIVEINPSDENKILHGNRGVTKL